MSSSLWLRGCSVSKAFLALCSLEWMTAWSSPATQVQGAMRTRLQHWLLRFSEEPGTHPMMRASVQRGS
jgi:hypothetical protein